MAPANPPIEIPKEERVQEASEEFLKAQKAREKSGGGGCRKPQKPEPWSQTLKNHEPKEIEIVKENKVDTQTMKLSPRISTRGIQ